MAASSWKALIAAVAGTLLLAACGGGGGDSAAGNTQKDDTAGGKEQNPLPVTTAIAGVFDGKSDTNQPLTAFLQDDGSYFIVYSDPAASQNFTNAVMGDGKLNNGSFSSTNGVDVALSGSGTQTADALTLSASYASGQSFKGSVSYAAGNRTSTFTADYNNAYESLPALGTVAGVYTGTITTGSLVEDNIQLTVSADGRLSGNLPCGCSIDAKLVPRSDGKAYDALLGFVGGTHPFSGKSFAGNVYLDAVGHRLYIIGRLSDSGEHAIFVGSRD